MEQPVIVTFRGLPFQCNASTVIEALGEEGNAIKLSDVLIGKKSMKLSKARKRNILAAGEGNIKCKTESQAQRLYELLGTITIGGRYLEPSILGIEKFRQERTWAARQQLKEKMLAEVHVRYLPYTATPTDVIDFFGEHSFAVSKVKLTPGDKHQNNGGSGYVTFYSTAAAENAVEMLNGVRFRGKSLALALNRPKEEPVGQESSETQSDPVENDTEENTVKMSRKERKELKLLEMSKNSSKKNTKTKSSEYYDDIAGVPISALKGKKALKVHH